MKRKGAKVRRFLISLIALLSIESTIAQVDNHPYQVFVDRNFGGRGLDRILFVDLLDGAETSVEVSGERYTTLAEAVIYYDTVEDQVNQIYPDGSIEKHSFIEHEEGSHRIDWLLSDDGRYIVWTLAFTDERERLSTRTYLADIDGDNVQLVLEDGPYDSGVRALPVALSGDLRTLYMDTHPDGISRFTPFNLYAGIFAVDVETGELKPLPDEQPASCLCGADIGTDRFLRMRWDDDFTGFDLHVYDLITEINQHIPTLRYNNYTSGDILITPDGNQAVYTLSRLTNFGSEDQSIRTVFVLVDLASMTQAELTNQITTFVRPVKWTEDNSAIILLSPIQDGTWKINLENGRLERIAELTYIGTLCSGCPHTR